MWWLLSPAPPKKSVVQVEKCGGDIFAELRGSELRNWDVIIISWLIYRRSDNNRISPEQCSNIYTISTRYLHTIYTLCRAMSWGPGRHNYGQFILFLPRPAPAGSLHAAFLPGYFPLYIQ